MNRFVLFVASNKLLCIFFISIFCLTFISFNLIELDIILGIVSIESFNILFKITIMFSTLFTVIFLPFYPLFFIISKSKNFNFLEKLSLTIFSNLAFYIIIAYLADSFEMPITGTLFFVSVLVIYFSLISFIIICELIKNSFRLIKPIRSSKNDKKFFLDFSILKYLKSKISINSLLLVVILALLSILHGIRFSYFYGTDAMYHVFIIKLITNLNYLPTDQYFGALGLHIFGSVINFFSNLDLLYLAKYFSFYTFFVSALLIYNFFIRIFRNKNLAILGVLILETTSLGFSNMMYQFWPTGLATIQSLLIFFLLYVRLQNLIGPEKPSRKEILKDVFSSDILIIGISLSAILTHSLITIVLIASYAFIFLIYFVKNYKRGIDFIILCLIIGIFLILYLFTDISEHWYTVDLYYLPWYLWVIGGIGASLIVWKLRNSINFSTGRFKKVIKGEKHKYYKKMEDRIIFPLFFSILIIFSLGFIIVNLIVLDLVFSKLFVALESFIIFFFGFWGLIIFQKKPRGKCFMLWLFGILAIFFVAFVIDFFQNYFYSGRILLLTAPVVIIGFISYIYKLLKSKPINIKKIKSVILITLIVMIFGQFLDPALDIDDIEYSLHYREVTAVQWFSNHTDESPLVISEFGWPYVFYFYDYPFEENNKSLIFYDIYDMIMRPKGYFKPDDHFYENGTNKLQDMKKNRNSNIYLVLDDNYLAFSGFEVYERLSVEELNQYYNMAYLNRILISKSETGVEVPYYWVI